MSVANCSGEPVKIKSLEDLFKLDKGWSYQIAIVINKDADLPSYISSYVDGEDNIIRGWILSVTDCGWKNKEAHIELIQWETEDGVVTFEAKSQSICLVEYDSGASAVEIHMHFSEVHPQFPIKKILLYHTTKSDFAHAQSRAIAHDINLSSRVFEESYSILENRIEPVGSSKYDLVKIILISIFPGFVEWIFSSRIGTTIAICIAIPILIEVMIERFLRNSRNEYYDNELKRLTREFYR